MPKALGYGADALILDLEDSVSLANKAKAREEVAGFLAEAGRAVPLFVRINPLDSGMADDDLDAVVPARPTGIVLPKAEGEASIADLDNRLQMRGDSDGLVLPIATETPRAVFALGEYAGASPRLCGITWGAEDLPAAIGALTARHPDGSYTPPYELARSLTLFAAAAANVPPIETVYPAIRDLDGLKAYAERGARDGFLGMMALHPDQVPIINQAFAPSEEAIAHARAVVAAFAAEPLAGVLMLDGRMIDRPHLVRARALLARL
ncbi:MAG: CoA ester lyase [Proteobacteria bacterium]|nr:CoA ester lyase [Pseudomonadota bacterium]